jgi:hypothetical protein
MRKEDKWNTQGKHEITGDKSCGIEAFKLPCTDQDKERRNFPGYETSVPGQDLMDEISHEGTTDTRGKRGMNKSGGSYPGKRKFA